MSQLAKSKMRLRNIDLLKGGLIISVILGHVLQGSVDESIWRTIIYSFHMPLFIGISGFLFNVDSVANVSLIGLIKKYALRIILPWTIAVVGYYLITGPQGDDSNIIIGLVKAFAYPFYHLWFIPGFLSWVVLTWLFKKINVSGKHLLFVALLISVGTLLLSANPMDNQNPITDLILHTFRPSYYFFFVLGLVYRSLDLKRPQFWEYIIPVVGFGGVIYLFYNPNELLSASIFFVLNASLISVCLKASAHHLILEWRSIEWIGLNSLGIYLWHLIPILICKSVIGTDDLALFYAATILLELVFIIVYRYLLRIDFLRKYVFGM